MLKRLLPIEARRRAYNNVTARWRKSSEHGCKVNSFTLEVRDRFEDEVNKCMIEKLEELQDESWWPTEFIVWLLHGLPCDDKNHQFVKISQGREPDVLHAKNLLSTVKRKFDDSEAEKAYEGRRLKRLKIKQDYELNKDPSITTQSDNSNRTYTVIMKKGVSVGKLRSEFCFVSSELITAHMSLPTMETNPIIKSILESRIKMLTDHMMDLKKQIAVEESKLVAESSLCEKENVLPVEREKNVAKQPSSRTVRLCKPKQNPINTPINTTSILDSSFTMNTPLSQLTDSPEDPIVLDEVDSEDE